MDLADAVWEQAVQQYDGYLDSIRSTLPRSVLHLLEGFYLHDVLAVAAVSRPEAVTSHPAVVDVETRGERWTFAGHAQPVRVLAWSHDGRSLASLGEDGAVKVLNAVTSAEKYVGKRAELGSPK